MIRLPPETARTDTRVPYTTRFRSRERGDGHAQVRALAGLRLRTHGGLLGDVATRRRCGGAACIGLPAVIVSDETICKAQRSMPDDPSTARPAPPHAVLDLAPSPPYRLTLFAPTATQTTPPSPTPP